MAPAMTPPTTPAPTAQPKQRASAVVGTAKVAKATAEAAARAVSVFVICVPFRWWRSADTERGFAARAILRATGTKRKEARQFVGNLLRPTEAPTYCPAQARMPDGFPSGILSA